MKVSKFFIAAMMFFTSLTFENQVLVTKSGIDSNWDVSISSNSAFALAQAEAY